MIVVLLGSPGVGKGTQGVRLGRTLGWAHVSTGDLLRAALRQGTALGLEARKYMDAGELVPDEVIVDLVREHLAGLDPARGVVFDGFPRTVAQAEALDAVLAAAGRAVDRVALLEADDTILFRRISGRRSSPSGRVYNIYFDPPRRDGLCDDTGERLIHRADDQPDTVRTRLEVYRETTAPLVGYYDVNGRLVRVDGAGGIDEVQAALRAAVGV
ncbi:MAG: adenylate kinase [Gemmatimonadetes bacterium]|nr:adenylate kinase [Gemmatimonadota bacterium]MXX71036.1 adenylate kinase [Gemmatimonadota bacterium]MYC92582.1 adenylate kinase [Gemmatimonadota bacterium]MYG36387.1 adenylate kinase [Gemmatimonadota bacterium]MYJ17753.1 adenylate kinase [Gemmatimonadota bacterium]